MNKNNKSQPENDRRVSDDRLDEICEEILQRDGKVAVDDDVFRAREVIRMIERVRDVSQTDTPRAEETLNNRPVQDAWREVFSEAMMPETIGRFKLKKLVGKGGFGLVFLANDPNLDRDIALKIPRPEVITTPESKARFLREGRAAASLAHPNIVPMFESGQDGPICFIASQFIPGETLADLIESNADSITPDIAASIVCRLAGAMEHAHQRGVLHRDLKPENILVESPAAADVDLADRVRIADFGLAKMELDPSETQAGALVGTPAFMSPEQTRSNQTVGPRSDIYSLGAILYRLLTGNPPFQENTIVDTIAAVRNEVPKSVRSLNPSVSRDLESICLKCLEKNHTRRYTSAFALSEDLSRFAQGVPVKARHLTNLDRLVRWAIRNPTVTALFVVTAVSAMIVSGLLVQTERHRQLAIESRNDVVQKSKHLQDAIDRLFVGIASTPELKLQGLDSLRQTMYLEASRLYQELVADVPEDIDLFLTYVETKLSFAKLTGSLGETRKSYEVIDELLDEIEGNLANDQLPQDLRRRLVHAKVQTLTQKLKHVTNPQESITIQGLILTIIDSADFQPENFQVSVAIALSNVAIVAAVTRDQEFAGKTSSRALGIWEKIPKDRLSSPILAQELIGCYTVALSAASVREDAQAGIPLAENAIDLFDLENLDFRALQPETVVDFCSMLTSHGFLLRDKDNAKAIAMTEQALIAMRRVAADHPRVVDFQAERCAIGYKYALLTFIAKDFEDAETLFRNEIEQSEELQLQFPETPNFKTNTTNCLWMLGLIHKKTFDYEDQMSVQLRSKRLIEQNPEQTLRTRIQLAGLNGEIGFCQTKLDDLQAGFDMIVNACKKLEEILIEDAASGEAKRFLSGNLEFASEAARRLGRYEDAIVYFDRRAELQGGKLKDSQLSAKIEIAVGLKDYDLAESLLADYEKIYTTLSDSDLFFDAKQFSFALKQLQKTKAEQGIPDAMALSVSDSIVAGAVMGLAHWIETTDKLDETIRRIQTEPDLEPLREYEQFQQLFN